MNTKEKLDIILITYNRELALKSTLEQIFDELSPIKDFDITILDNCSDDGTQELVEEYKQNHKNIKYIKNRINIGGCANIAKALVEIPLKEYVWVLCDNDSYDWTSWEEVEKSIEDNIDVILTRNCEITPDKIFYKAAFLPACIYKTKNIDNTVAENIFDNIKTLFPHLALIAKNINDKNSFYAVKNNVVIIGKNQNQNKCFTRGVSTDEISSIRRNMFWSVGYFSSLELIKDTKTRNQIINSTKHYRKNLYELFKSIVIKNELHFNKYFFNYIQIFRMLNFKQKIKFLLAYFSTKFAINILKKDYSFYEISEKDEWEEYFEKINQKQYIEKLIKKLKSRKVLIYGAGLCCDILFKNYDLKDLNIVAITDKKFEKTNKEYYKNIRAIKPEEIKSYDFDAILFTLKLYEKIEKDLKSKGIKQKTYSLIKKTKKYPTRS